MPGFKARIPLFFKSWGSAMSRITKLSKERFSNLYHIGREWNELPEIKQ